ncbi:MAG: lipoyl synthase [Alistipes sp.]|nr:lipoyl synthase [Alistipes sp.]
MPKLYDGGVPIRKPDWLKIRLHKSDTFAEVERIVSRHSLHTICSSGRCPNKSECWSRRTATFMILGDICTRNCRFCATKTGHPLPPDASEPEKVAESVSLMGLRHVVVTSVTRDDLPDRGAAHWAATVEAIRAKNSSATIELLISDLDANPALLDVVIASKPDIIGHNIETVSRLTPLVRTRATYANSLATLRYMASRGVTVKSGLMVGLGESETEVVQTLHDLYDAGVRLVTIGQYLQPTQEHVPVAEYVTPETFEKYRLKAVEIGFDFCASAPLVRSSYLADEALKAIKA